MDRTSRISSEGRYILAGIVLGLIAGAISGWLFGQLAIGLLLGFLFGLLYAYLLRPRRAPARILRTSEGGRKQERVVEPVSAEEAALYGRLATLAGSATTADNLIAYERSRSRGVGRMVLIENAIARLERDRR